MGLNRRAWTSSRLGDLVGDVNLSRCALTAKSSASVAHVEAGLRSLRYVNAGRDQRLCTDVISDLLFTTDTMADETCEVKAFKRENTFRRQHDDDTLQQQIVVPASYRYGTACAGEVCRPHLASSG